MPFKDIHDEDPIETYTTLVKAIAPMGLAYVHVLRTPPLATIFEILRPLFSGPFAAGGAFDQRSGNAMLESGGADFIVFGKLFTSNPDLPERFAAGAPLTSFDASTFSTPGPKGYIDFPAMSGSDRWSDISHSLSILAVKAISLQNGASIGMLGRTVAKRS